MSSQSFTASPRLRKARGSAAVKRDPQQGMRWPVRTRPRWPPSGVGLHSRPPRMACVCRETAKPLLPCSEIYQFQMCTLAEAHALLGTHNRSGLGMPLQVL